MLIFIKIFRLASLANQDTYNLEIYKLKRLNYFNSFSLKVSVLVQNIQKVCTNYSTSNPLHYFQNNWF